jgi:glycosyltransferase involved in cell wall biosynthesis
MYVYIITPHTRVSGGVKVIFRIATGLMQRGIKVRIIASKFIDQVMSWYAFERMPFKIVEAKHISSKEYNEADCIVTFGDGPGLVDVTIPKILFLQGYGTQDKEKEIINLSKEYSMIITTSQWLHDLMKQIGHKNVHVISPGIDDIFMPIKRRPNRIPVIGGLFHQSPEKQFNLFINTIVKLATKYNQKTHSLIFASKPVNKIKTLDMQCLPYSIISNPPQSLIPAMYSSCDVWFATSKNEGFGLTPLEAMACGVPIVWYQNKGLYGNMIHKKNCIFAQNKHDAAQAIMDILRTPKMRRELIANGHELVKKFNWKNSIDKFVACLQMAIKK